MQCLLLIHALENKTRFCVGNRSVLLNGTLLRESLCKCLKTRSHCSSSLIQRVMYRTVTEYLFLVVRVYCTTDFHKNIIRHFKIQKYPNNTGNFQPRFDIQDDVCPVWGLHTSLSFPKLPSQGGTLSSRPSHCIYIPAQA